MKFGQTIKHIVKTDKKYGHHFLQYIILKKFIKRGLSHSREVEFIQMLENEIERIKSIVNSKVAEMKMAASSVYLMMHTGNNEENILQMRAAADNLAEELPLLERFIHYNNEGLKKIVKKHDRWSGIDSFWFDAQGKRQFLIEACRELESLMIRLSDIYHYIRQQENYQNENITPASNSGIDRETFERTSTKYWVSPADVFALKTMIIKYIPVNIFQRPSGTENLQPLAQQDKSIILLRSHEDLTADVSNLHNSGWISSVYLDNDKLACYHSRINMEEGARLIRVRWYGDPNEANRADAAFLPQPPLEGLFVERKTHHESWILDSSKKERFDLDEHAILPFLQGVEDVLPKKGGKKQQLASSIQYTVVNSNLKPMLRTIYKRTAFQLDDNNDVRITLDNHMKFVDESVNKPVNAWRRSEDEIGSHQDWIVFHSAILEVKLRTAAPPWLEAILAQRIVKECHKFSKYQHGAAIFHADKVKLFPYWLDDNEMQEALRREKRSLTECYNLNCSFDSIETRLSETNSTCSVATIPMEDLKSDHHKIVINRPNELQPATKALKNRRAYMKKPRASRRVKVEPKTYFANERTFIQWLTAAILLATLSAALIDLGDINTQITGLIFMPLALVILVYAITIFYIRLHAIKSRRKHRYDDCFGPGFLVLLLCGALTSTIYLYFSRNMQIMFPSFGQPVESNTCHMFNISALPMFYEPSDLAIPSLKSETMWTCSMNMVSKVDLSNRLVIQTIKIKEYKELDCEGLVFLPSKPDRLYVGSEKPGNMILELDLKQEKVVRVIDLTSVIGKKSLLEGLAFYPGYVQDVPDTRVLGSGTFFIAGKGDIVAFFINDETFTVEKQFKIALPAQYNNTVKIGALTVQENILYAVLDNEKVLLGWNLLDGSVFSQNLPGSSTQWEGVAVIPSSSRTKHVYLAQDNPAQIWRFNFNALTGFESC